MHTSRNMAESGKHSRGSYLQYLSESLSGSVPRTTKHRWKKSRCSDVSDQESTSIERALGETVDDVADFDDTSIWLLDEPEPLSENNTFDIDGSDSTWFANNEEELLLMAEEPALLTDYEVKDDQDTAFAEDFLDDEILEEEINESKDECREPLDKNANSPLYAGCRLTLGISMLLIITFAVRRALSGVALADLLTLIELHCLLPNNCAKTTKLLRDFFGKLKTPIEFHYYCSFCQQYFGTQKPVRCTNAACLLDFDKKGSQVPYFIVIYTNYKQ